MRDIANNLSYFYEFMFHSHRYFHHSWIWYYTTFHNILISHDVSKCSVTKRSSSKDSWQSLLLCSYYRMQDTHTAGCWSCSCPWFCRPPPGRSWSPPTCKVSAAGTNAASAPCSQHSSRPWQLLCWDCNIQWDYLLPFYLSEITYGHPKSTVTDVIRQPTASQSKYSH